VPALHSAVLHYFGVYMLKILINIPFRLRISGHCSTKLTDMHVQDL